MAGMGALLCMLVSVWTASATRSLKWAGVVGPTEFYHLPRAAGARDRKKEKAGSGLQFLNPCSGSPPLQPLNLYVTFLPWVGERLFWKE